MLLCGPASKDSQYRSTRLTVPVYTAYGIGLHGIHGTLPRTGSPEDIRRENKRREEKTSPPIRSDPWLRQMGLTNLL